jgi:hypothetical protein
MLLLLFIAALIFGGDTRVEAMRAGVSPFLDQRGLMCTHTSDSERDAGPT